MSKVSSAVTEALVKGPDHSVEKNIKVDEENIQQNLINKTWDEMDAIYSDLASILANNSETFKSLVSMASNELKDFISEEEKKELDIIYAGYVRDLESICNDMLKVKKSYNGYSGKQKGEKETLMSISVLESYIVIHDKVKAVFPPMSIRLAEIVGGAAKHRDDSLTDKAETNV